MTAGRVKVNGAWSPSSAPRSIRRVDVVSVDGKPCRLAEEPVYLALNKPAGVVTTMSDPQGRTTVAALVPVKQHPGLFPVGRLDYETTGLLLFTTDGELSHRLLHPRWKVEKTYRVLVDGRVDEPELDRLREGVSLDDGLTAPARVSALRPRRHELLRDRDPRGTQATGAPDVLGDRTSGASSSARSASVRWRWAICPRRRGAT